MKKVTSEDCAHVEIMKKDKLLFVGTVCKSMLQANYQCIFTGSMDPIQDAYKYESSRVMDLLKLKAEASEKILESC